MKDEIDQGKGMLKNQQKTKEIWDEILQTRESLDHQISVMTNSLSRVLKKHEYEYMSAYNIQVKRKVNEVKNVIVELQKNSNTEMKDMKIAKLEKAISKLRSDLMDQEKLKEQLRTQIATWKKKHGYEKAEHRFYHDSALENKRKNKLLKVAVGRLQFEYDKLKEKY